MVLSNCKVTGGGVAVPPGPFNTEMVGPTLPAAAPITVIDVLACGFTLALVGWVTPPGPTLTGVSATLAMPVCPPTPAEALIVCLPAVVLAGIVTLVLKKPLGPIVAVPMGWATSLSSQSVT